MAMTQKEFDEACDMLKIEFDKAFNESGQNSVVMAMVIGKTKDIMTQIASFYELEIRPAAESEGLTVKTLKELLGVEMTITAH